MTEQQWLNIYRETVHPLYGYMAKRTGGNRELTEDIVQESYLRAINDWNRKSVPVAPLAWLMKVARNVLIDYLRKKRWNYRAAPENEPDTGFQRSEDQFESLEIFLAISSLGRKKAKILEAFYYDGKSIREIANEMATSEKAVEGRLRQARLSLKSLLPNLSQNGGKNGSNHRTR